MTLPTRAEMERRHERTRELIERMREALHRLGQALERHFLTRRDTW